MNEMVIDPLLLPLKGNPVKLFLTLFFSLAVIGLTSAQPPAAVMAQPEAVGQKVVGKRLGLKPDTSAKPKVKLSWKLGVPPASPASADHLAGWTFNMGGNDRYGSCGPTGGANHLQMSRKYLLNLDRSVSLAQVLDLYRRSSCCPPFDPATGANDGGVMMSDLLEAMEQGGLDGDKVVAYASLADKSDASVYASINEFGGVLFAVDLQTAQQAQTDAGYWDYRRSASWGGHAILAGKYDKSNSRVWVVTWAKPVYTTAAFRRYQLSEVWLPVWKSAVESGKFFANIDKAQFLADYKAITGEDFPVPIPDPPTPVPPTPVPPTPPSGGYETGTWTEVWIDGRLKSRKFTPGVVPIPVVGDTYEIDLTERLSKIDGIFAERRKERIRNRIANAISGGDHADVKIDGDKVILTKKAGVTPSQWEEIIALILEVIARLFKMFG